MCGAVVGVPRRCTRGACRVKAKQVAVWMAPEVSGVCVALWRGACRGKAKQVAVWVVPGVEFAWSTRSRFSHPHPTWCAHNLSPLFTPCSLSSPLLAPPSSRPRQTHTRPYLHSPLNPQLVRPKAGVELDGLQRLVTLFPPAPPLPPPSAWHFRHPPFLNTKPQPSPPPTWCAHKTEVQLHRLKWVPAHLLALLDDGLPLAQLPQHLPANNGMREKGQG